jgi:hypothetical protein
VVFPPDSFPALGLPMMMTMEAAQEMNQCQNN